MTTHLPTPAPFDLTISEAAAEIRSTEKFVKELIRRGDLEAIRYGTRFTRIPRASLDAWKAAHSTFTAAQQRAKLLGEETVAAIAESADAAPPLSEEQRDTIRSAFKMPRPNPHPKRGASA